MNEDLIIPLKAISNTLFKSQLLIQHNSLNQKEIILNLNQISHSLDKINSNFVSYQSKITNQPWFQFIIGALVTLFATWIIEYLKKRRRLKEYLYYADRMLVDQLNMANEMEVTIKRFLDTQIVNLIKNIKATPAGVYSVDSTFFPLFSVRSLPHNINQTHSGSGYIDNKIAKVYQLSNDLPFIINDIRLQLRDTLERNEKIAFEKLNSADVQKLQFIANVENFRKITEDEILKQNLPLYKKLLLEAIVPLREKQKISNFSWKVKYDPKWKFFFRKADYIEERKALYKKMNSYFDPSVAVQIEEIEKMNKGEK